VLWPIVVLTVGVALGLAAGVTIGRRRRVPAFVVPDTIPDELEMQELDLRR
jgi:hypothetical protein